MLAHQCFSVMNLLCDLTGQYIYSAVTCVEVLGWDKLTKVGQRHRVKEPGVSGVMGL